MKNSGASAASPHSSAVPLRLVFKSIQPLPPHDTALQSVLFLVREKRWDTIGVKVIVAPAAFRRHSTFVQPESGGLSIPSDALMSSLVVTLSISTNFLAMVGTAWLRENAACGLVWIRGLNGRITRSLNPPV